MSNLADLTVKVGADDAELGTGLKSAESKVGKFATGLKVAVGAAGAAAGATLAAGFAKNLEIGEAQGKLNAQLGISGERAGELGKIAGSLYSNAYGDSLGSVNEAIKGVIQSGLVMEDASSSQIESVTGKVLNLATAFDQDLGGATAAVGQMMKTGLAPDADAALDIITRGFQQGVDKSGDFLDTLNEYGTQFRKVGLDGTTATGLLSQGLKAGARDADLVADSIKEFSIRAIDGSKTTAEGFKALGLDAADMANKIAAGGPTASAALDLTLDKLRAIEDPVKRDAAAVALFGTQAEDMGQALYALDPSSAAKALGTVKGATDQTADSLATAQSKITGMQRTVEMWTASLVTADGPVGSLAASVMAFGGPAVDMAGSLGMVAVATGGLIPKLGTMAAAAATSSASMVASMVRFAAGVVAQGAVAVGSMTVTAASYVAQWVVMAAGAMARAVVMAAAWVVAMGPVGWIIAGIIALVALIIANWDTVKNVTVAVFTAVWNFIKGVWEGIKSVFWGAVQFIVGLFMNFTLPGLIMKHWATIKAVFTEGINAVVGFMRGLPGRILGALGDLGSLLKRAGMAVINGLWSGISSMGSWLKDKILGFIRSFVPGPVLRFLGIASPSKLFAGIGRNVALGLAQGITGSESLVGKAAARLAAMAVVDVGAGAYNLDAPRGNRSVLSLPGGASAAASRAGGGQITFDIQTYGRTAEDMLAELIRRFVTVNGGDVQKALGR